MINRSIVRESDDISGFYFPDIVTDGSKLICCYVESQNHSIRKGSRLWISRSDDFGIHWEHQIISESDIAGDSFWNAPRMIVDIDLKITIVIDKMPAVKIGYDFQSDLGDQARLEVWAFESDNLGQTWNKRKTMITGLCPSISHAINGDVVVAVNKFDAFDGIRKVQTWRSNSLYSNEWITALVPGQKNVCEGELIEIGDKWILLMRAMSSVCVPGARSISADGCRTWSEPEGFIVPGGMHRPNAARLRSGHFFISSRLFAGSGAGSQMTIASLVPEWSMLAPRISQNALIMPLDYNARCDSDQGYTGSCQIDDGTIFVVNYLNPPGHGTGIYFYQLMESDFDDSMKKQKPIYEYALIGGNNGKKICS